MTRLSRSAWLLMAWVFLVSALPVIASIFEAVTGRYAYAEFCMGGAVILAALGVLVFEPPTSWRPRAYAAQVRARIDSLLPRSPTKEGP